MNAGILRVAAVAILATGVGGGVALAAGRMPATAQPLSTPGKALPQTIVALGDSITKGDWDTAVTGGWVARLNSKLTAAYPGSRVTIRNAGVDGDTTMGALARLGRDVLASHPQMVIVSIGTNDFDERVPTAVFSQRLKTLVHQLQSAPGAPVVVLASMLPEADQSAKVLAAQRSYNALIQHTAAAANVGYLDLFDGWLALGTSYLQSLRHDTEHPNPTGYELLASTTAAFLEAGYFNAKGMITAPRVAPTCSPVICDVS